ncbi:DUF4149 domain-containing protein [bacterium]|nr:MAG: DUF4149 domain-containing protein [bacterium]
MSFLAQFLYLLGLVLWVGGIVFFSFFTTPTIFTQLPKDMASLVITAIFPKYYVLGYVAGGMMALGTLTEALLVKQLPLIRVILLALMLGCSVYAGTVVRPQVHDLKVQMKTVEEDSDLGKSLKVRFDGLHRRSVILNIVVLAGGLILIGIVAFRLRL